MRTIAQRAASLARWVGQRPDVVVVALALLTLAIAWPTVGLSHDAPSSLWPVLGVMTVLPVLVLRRAPALSWAMAAGGCLIWWGWVDQLPTAHMPWPVMQFLVLLATLLSVALWARWYEVLTAVLATSVLLAVGMPDELKGWAFGQALFVGVGLLIRWLVLSRLQLAQQKVQAESERAQRAVVEERARIARELHDVVAHHMSMVVVQAQSAPVRLGIQSDELAAEFAQIEDSARQALGEVRGVLGVLREREQGAARAPQPGLEELPALLESTRSAGMDLTWSLGVQASDCPPGTALVLHRIVQESLANAGRHAPGSRVEVRVQRTENWLTLTVHNTRPVGQPRRGERAGGAGIDGMRARAEAVGGTLRAEPDVSGGFIVQADVPLGGRPTMSSLG